MGKIKDIAKRHSDERVKSEKPKEVGDPQFETDLMDFMVNAVHIPHEKTLHKLSSELKSGTFTYTPFLDMVDYEPYGVCPPSWHADEIKDIAESGGYVFHNHVEYGSQKVYSISEGTISNFKVVLLQEDEGGNGVFYKHTMRFTPDMETDPMIRKFKEMIGEND